jgi:predicted transposase YbfD/YdcC
VQSGLAGWSDWPGLAQVCRIVHQSRRRGRWAVEVHYKVTSLSSEQADAEDLLQFSRGHWAIENRLHYVRDVTLGEDASRIRSGSAPQAMAALRNTVLSVLRLTGATNCAAGLRAFGWQPERAAAVLGLRRVQPVAVETAAARAA